MTAESGVVVECFGRRVVVRDAAGANHHCKLRGRRLDVVVGDEIRFEPGSVADDGLVLDRQQRRNVLQRCDSRGLPESIAANLDQLGVVVAPQPVCDPFMIDRYIAGALLSGIAPLLIVNKSDLQSASGALEFSVALASAGIPTVQVSARASLGFESLIGRLSGKRTLLVGQSGVGKSSLLNALIGMDARATRSLSESSGEGRHTTVSSAIFQQPWGELADSPGVRDYAPALVEPIDVQRGFEEISSAAPDCRFADCLHLREPQCQVQSNVAAGRIDARRYESYRRLLNLMRQLGDRRGPRSG